jgi:hypothetical protein
VQLLWKHDRFNVLKDVKETNQDKRFGACYFLQTIIQAGLKPSNFITKPDCGNTKRNNAINVPHHYLSANKRDSLAAKRSFRLLQKLANAKEKSTPQLRKWGIHLAQVIYWPLEPSTMAR